METQLKKETYNYLLEGLVFNSKPGQEVKITNFFDPRLYGSLTEKASFHHDITYLLELGFIYYVDNFGEVVCVSDLGRSIAKDRLRH